MDLMDQMFDRMDKFERMRSRMQERFAPEEEEEEKKPAQLPAAAVETKVEVDKTQMKPLPLAGVMFGRPINYGERGPDESMMDYGIRLFMNNPELGTSVIQMAMKQMSSSSIGQLVTQLIAKGMPGAASMIQAQHAQLTAPNGVPPNGAVATPNAPAAATPPTWGPPRV
jgi:hypothetical protein